MSILHFFFFFFFFCKKEYMNCKSQSAIAINNFGAEGGGGF